MPYAKEDVKISVAAIKKCPTAFSSSSAQKRRVKSRVKRESRFTCWTFERSTFPHY